MKFLLLVTLFLSPLAQAESPSVKCDIETLADAQLCMEKVAAAYPEFEEPNDGLTSDSPLALQKAMKALSSREGVRDAKKADFAGLIVAHGDEHHIYYFALTKGQNVAVKEIYDLNLADLTDTLEEPLTEDKLNVDTYFLGLDARHIDAYAEVRRRLESLSRNLN